MRRAVVTKTEVSVVTNVASRLPRFFGSTWLRCIEMLCLRWRPALCNHHWSWASIQQCPQASQQHQYPDPSHQHQQFPRGLSSKFCPGPMLLNFCVRMGAGKSVMTGLMAFLVTKIIWCTLRKQPFKVCVFLKYHQS